MLWLAWLLLPLASACPPQPNGNCYAGSYSPGAAPSFSNQRCTNDGFKDWCAVTYQPASGLANFGCASSLQQPLGTEMCGLGIDNNGCKTVNTPQGPCHFCCCKGGSCNHPQVYMQQAQLQYGLQVPPGMEWNGANANIFHIAITVLITYLLF